MPALADALNKISEQTAQVYALSSHNAAPSGRYTAALLDSINANPDRTHARHQSARRKAGHGDPGGEGVLKLVRDAHESELRLYKRIGEADGGARKRAELREGVVTPIREQRRLDRQHAGGEDADVLLRTALRLVQD